MHGVDPDAGMPVAANPVQQAGICQLGRDIERSVVVEQRGDRWPRDFPLVGRGQQGQRAPRLAADGLSDRAQSGAHADVADLKLTLKDYTDPAALKDLSDGEIFYIIKNGKGQMPPDGGRTKPDDIWNMVILVRTFAKK